MKSILWPLAIAGLLAILLLIASFVSPLQVHIRAITNVAVSSTGRWLAAGTHDGKIELCDRTTAGACTMANIESDELNDLQFSPDESFLAVANSNIQLLALDHRSNSFLRIDRRKYGTIRFDNTGTKLLTINAQSEIELIDIKSRVALKRICCSSFYGEVSYSENYTQIVNAGHWPRIWTTSGKIVGGLAADRQYATFRPITIDETGRVLFMGSQDGRVYAWSLDKLSLLKRSPPQNDYVDTIAIIPKIKKIAYCGFGKRLRLWSVADGSDVELSTLSSSSNLVALPDGKSILFGTNQGTIETWDLEASPHRTSTLSPVPPL